MYKKRLYYSIVSIEGTHLHQLILLHKTLKKKKKKTLIVFKILLSKITMNTSTQWPEPTGTFLKNKAVQVRHELHHI